jgi:hypothetical protein
MRYSRYYTEKNQDDSRTVVRLGPAATLAIMLKEVFLGAICGGCFIIALKVRTIDVQEAIIWPLMVLFPLLAWGKRRAARRR